MCLIPSVVVQNSEDFIYFSLCSWNSVSVTSFTGTELEKKKQRECLLYEKYEA